MSQQTRKEICPLCKGSGKTFRNNSIFDWGWKVCEQCNGTGMIEIMLPPRRRFA